MRAVASSTLIPDRSRSSAAEGRSRRVSTRPLYAAIRTRMSQSWRTTVAHQSTEDTHHTGPVRAEPELAPGNLRVAAGRDDTLELHRPAAIGLAAGWRRRGGDWPAGLAGR
jgi:hypothetical protein